MQVSLSQYPLRAGQVARLKIELEDASENGEWHFAFTVLDDVEQDPFGDNGLERRMRFGDDFEPEISFTVAGEKTLTATFGSAPHHFPISVLTAQAPEVPDTKVSLVSAEPPLSEDQILWTFISQITTMLRFEEFDEYIRPQMKGNTKWYGTEAYRLLRKAADKFVGIAADPIAASRKPRFKYELTEGTAQAGIARSYVSSERADLDEKPFTLAIGRKLLAAGGGSAHHLGFPLPNVPFVELIWNYWHEEAMLVQSLNHILARFQNRRLGNGRDTLGRLDLNPLLPLRNLLWGFVDDERRRLTVRRRAAEYEYQYGLRLLGRAVPHQSTVVERRTQFLEAFHGLLHACHGYYKERDDLTVEADAFPLLSSLREVHLVLARGAHNQFADLPVTARAEMLTMQWILAQKEMREFLGGPTMVPYEEQWMDRVDTMKQLNGWSDASVTHFFELAVTGEQVLLSIRHGRWNESGRVRDDAANWALTWRDEIQRYIHAYRAVTGADLATTIDATMPSTLLADRLERQAMRV